MFNDIGILIHPSPFPLMLCELQIDRLLVYSMGQKGHKQPPALRHDIFRNETWNKIGFIIYYRPAISIAALIERILTYNLSIRLLTSFYSLHFLNIFFFFFFSLFFLCSFRLLKIHMFDLYLTVYCGQKICSIIPHTRSLQRITFDSLKTAMKTSATAGSLTPFPAVHL